MMNEPVPPSLLPRTGFYVASRSQSSSQYPDLNVLARLTSLRWSKSSDDVLVKCVMSVIPPSRMLPQVPWQPARSKRLRTIACRVSTCLCAPFISSPAFRLSSSSLASFRSAPPPLHRYLQSTKFTSACLLPVLAHRRPCPPSCLPMLATPLPSSRSRHCPKILINRAWSLLEPCSSLFRSWSPSTSATRRSLYQDTSQRRTPRMSLSHDSVFECERRARAEATLNLISPMSPDAINIAFTQQEVQGHIRHSRLELSVLREACRFKRKLA